MKTERRKTNFRLRYSFDYKWHIWCTDTISKIKDAYSSQTKIPNIFSAILLLHIRFIAQLDEMAKLFCKFFFRDWIIIKNLHTQMLLMV
jgi:hypothetical protein